jgi:transcriptional regulator with XRE-family HTH domain
MTTTDDTSYALTAARRAVVGEVKAEMARKGLTPTEVGRITGKGQQYWSRRTTGTVPFDVDDFAALSTILQVPMSRFVPSVIPTDEGPGGASNNADRRSYFMSPVSDSNRRPPLYIVDGSSLEDDGPGSWPAELPKLKTA